MLRAYNKIAAEEVAFLVRMIQLRGRVRGAAGGAGAAGGGNYGEGTSKGNESGSRERAVAEGRGAEGRGEVGVGGERAGVEFMDTFELVMPLFDLSFDVAHYQVT